MELKMEVQYGLKVFRELEGGMGRWQGIIE
jgi:hypothetical protein